MASLLLRMALAIVALAAFAHAAVAAGAAPAGVAAPADVAAPAGGAAPGAACGGVDDPCQVPLGDYHVVLPEAREGRKAPAFVYFHGAGGSGRTSAQAPFAKALAARGYAVILPNGLQRPGARFGPGWSFRPESPSQRDEMAFTHEMIEDAVARFDLDPSRIVLTGYSIGGSLVWYLACRDAHLAAAYAPYAGGFWRPQPTRCAGPVKLLHTHGWRDQTVPLEGRPLRAGAIYQGDIFEGLQTWRAANGCELLRADVFDTDGRFWKRRWTSCQAGSALELALWAGGHEPPDAEWAEMVADWVEEVLGPEGAQ